MWNYILFSLFICFGGYMYYNKENIVTVIDSKNDDKNIIAFNMIFKGIKINKYKIYDEYISYYGDDNSGINLTKSFIRQCNQKYDDFTVV